MPQFKRIQTVCGTYSRIMVLMFQTGTIIFGSLFLVGTLFAGVYVTQEIAGNFSGLKVLVYTAGPLLTTFLCAVIIKAIIKSLRLFEAVELKVCS